MNTALSPEQPTAFTNARLIDPASGLDAKGALLSLNGKIADLGANLFSAGAPDGIQEVDCGGHILAPGLVDMRVQLGEPGEEHKDTIASATAAAASGGITTMICLPNTNPPIDDVSLIEFMARRARENGIVKIYPYAAVTRGCASQELTEMGILSEAGAMGFTDGRRAVANSLVMRRALSYASTFDLLVMQHPEDPQLVEEGVMNEGEVATRLGLSGIPSAAEAIMVARDMRLVELTGARYHAAHISTADSIDIVRRAKARGLPVTCDTAPHYFTLNETAIGDYRTFTKTSPPLRGEEDRLAVIAGLRDGTIDAIASDHAPQDQDSKRLPFAQAECGIAGLETLLPLTLALYHAGELPLIDALGKVTANPAGLLRLGEGRLAVGAPADLAVIDPDRPWRIDPDSFLSKSKNSPFDGHPVQGGAEITVVGRRIVYNRTS
ncbi:MAG: dihydroorotase [Pseudomonadota bacterium]|nr:dihydroorotase [Pseudomonadota bacterium]